ncbi:MAG: caspase family protein [Alphaproteobacteria bacterium]|nr:caspase family protein [Alphaproteobacteria bacterium]
MGIRSPAAIAVAAAMCLATSSLAQPAGGEKRVALVIGNGAYREAPLKNPVNDARAMAARLGALGFDVVARENATRQGMADAVVEFARKLGPDTAALVYYAGHGIQSRGRNYLIPVDAPLKSETDLRFQAVDVGALTDELEQAQARISFLILDACRNNPFERRMRGAQRGLAAIDAARGTFIAYATAPGSVAADGDDANGVYTAALLRALDLPGLKAEEVFKRVRIEVSEATGNLQVPWESSSLTGDFVFNLAAAPTGTVAAPAAVDREVVFWQSIQASRRAGDFEAYLQRYPQGEFAPLARSRLAELQAAGATPSLPGPSTGRPVSAPPQVAAAPAPAPQVAVGAPIGCFKDKGNPLVLKGRDLDGRVMNWQGMTPEFCIQQCAKHGFTYAGLQYGSFCFCGNSYGSNGPATNCNVPCNGDDRRTCGGEWANHVYRAR